MLLGTSQEALGEQVDKKLNGSHDEHVTQFLGLIKPAKKKGSAGGYFLAAAGELILASFLIIAGLATILPSVVGLTSPQQLVSFITQITSNISLQTLHNPVIPALELLLAIGLLLGAFNTVRLAAIQLSDTGVMPAPEQK